ncbi:MAG: hypothetical protein IKQ15_02225 [Kiritimatiellae bacterium]|nr:hypothetical protein [Kiritimatiellia bacterium]
MENRPVFTGNSIGKFFPIIGKAAKIFSNHWKKRGVFSNHWKLFFQSLENFRRAGGGRIVQNPGREGGRGDGASGPFSVTCRFFVL